VYKIRPFSRVKPFRIGNGIPLFNCEFRYGMRTVLRAVDDNDCKCLQSKRVRFIASTN
jgi:hypothetical protein